MENYKLEYIKWLEAEHIPCYLKNQLELMTEEEIRESFHQNITFGTSGLREVMGIGVAKINSFVIHRASRGLAEFLKDGGNTVGLGNEITCIISYDSRHNSRKFAMVTALALLSRGVKVKIFDRLSPVPLLSYAIKKIGCQCGVMITASHNDNKYNGYKVYDERGCQLTSEKAKLLEKFIDKEPIFSKEVDNFEKLYFWKDEGVQIESLSELGFLKNEKIDFLGEEVLDMYLNDISDWWHKNYPRARGLENLEIVYSPLNGAGKKGVEGILNKHNIGQIYSVPIQAEPNGDFETCPSPNPEKDETYKEARKVMERGGKIILVTDPDADRLGSSFKNELVRGDDLGILILNYLLEIKKEELDCIALEKYLNNKIVIKNYVTTRFFDKICRAHGIEVYETDIGFKNIGNKACLLAKEGKELIMGTEESNGYMMPPFIKDKDGISSSLVVSSMLAYYQEQGKTFNEVLDELRRKYGYFYSVNKNIVITDVDYKAKMKSMMENLRKNDIKIIDDITINEKIDYLELSGVNINILEFRLENGTRIMIRPSGTEPKIKIYGFIEDEKREVALKNLDDFDRVLKKVVLDRW